MSVTNGAFTRTNGFGSDAARVVPRFYIESVPNAFASERAGRPIFTDEERVEIILPGNPYTRPIQQVTEEHRQKWPKEYAAFKAGLELCPDGTPLEEWPRLKRAQVLELKALGFMTVENIAAMDDHAVQRIGMGGRELRNLAIAFLDEAANSAEVERLTAENNRKASENAALQRQLDEIKALVEPMHAELMALKNGPNAIQAHVPGLSDPVELAKQHNAANQPQAAPVSSLDAIAAPRRPGRKPLPRDAAGNIIREGAA